MYFQVPYYNFSDAIELARSESRLVHSILLWGALDDQSCWGSARTLRETALECPRVLHLLEEHFISNWNLVVDMKALEADASQPELAQMARTLLAQYEFPVMMMVLDPRDGSIVHSTNANTFLDLNEQKQGSADAM